MKISGSLICNLRAVPHKIQEMDALGYDAAFSAEINNDPFFPLLLAAEHSKTIGLHTSISVAFARNPMNMANLAHDLNQYSQGRFTLGLGSQIKPHIEKRFSMPWSRPAPRMREYILAMRAIWNCWHNDEPLKFHGEFYRHTLMTPMFVPADKEFGAPKVALAAVGPVMTEVAGEVADGLIAHGFTTPKYLREVTLPALQKGFAKGGRQREQFDICCPVMVVSGHDKEEKEASLNTIRQQLAFYGSTPAYRRVLEVHGWGDVGDELNELSKQGKWVEMGLLLTDEMVNEFAIVAEPDNIAAELHTRYGDLIDGWLCTYESGDIDEQSMLIRAVRNHAE
ncbi:MAG: TIGR03617 family F420-dependent LLM class oxidoreductase [Pseudomonadales bacterium]